MSGLTKFDLDNFEMLLDPRRASWFTAHLVRLIQKADSDNRELLRMAYPDEVAAFERWFFTGDAREPQARP